MPTRCALYARVSTTDQHCENQLAELRAFCAARGWTVTREYLDQGVSGAKERRPALDELVRDARRRRFDVLACWRLDRLGRNLRHLVLRKAPPTPGRVPGDSRARIGKHAQSSLHKLASHFTIFSSQIRRGLTEFTVSSP